jgi:hypothetical protein
VTLIRPRLTDYHNISLAQAQCDFAIPFFEEDVPLYVDPFLLWKSPSQQDQALHTSLMSSFNRQGWLSQRGKSDEAEKNFIIASECDEVGLGVSMTRKGHRIGAGTAQQILRLFEVIPQYQAQGFAHSEETQLYVDGISKDRISDFTCNFLKSFLIDYTMDQCENLGIPLYATSLDTLYDYRSHTFLADQKVNLPLNPMSQKPLLLVPKRWLRFVPWISFDDYFASYCPKDDVVNQHGSDERVHVLSFNRDNYGAIAAYVQAKERTAETCHNDPLFKQIPIISAKRKFAEIKALPTGNDDKNDKKYEHAASQLLASMFYPHLDYADVQVRSDGGATIRDLVFYNNRDVDFLQEILADYGSRQIVMELKNVSAIGRDHINQLNRYLTNEFGSFGILITRNPLPRAMFRNTVELWSGQRRCIIDINDSDIEMMVEVFESKQRQPVEVLKKKYIEFRRACPS